MAKQWPVGGNGWRAVPDHPLALAGPVVMTRQRLARRTTTLANGTSVVRAKLVEVGPLEWQVQAEAVRRCRALPGFGDEAGPGVTFTLAGDFNAGRRGMQESVKAKATGIVAGEEDIR